MPVLFCSDPAARALLDDKLCSFSAQITIVMKIPVVKRSVVLVNNTIFFCETNHERIAQNERDMQSKNPKKTEQGEP
jgi:hypothetical protein